VARIAPWRQRDCCGPVDDCYVRALSLTLCRFVRSTVLFLLGPCFLGGCHFQRNASGPTIEFTRVPAAVQGGPDKLDIIEGRVTGRNPKSKLVLYARSGKWWIQPLRSEPYTAIRPDGTWTNNTHVGTEYAALLVDADFHPAAMLNEIPARGGDVVAAASVRGSESESQVSRFLRFSGYEWRIRNAPSNRGGRNNYDPGNAWTDSSGALHLRIAKVSGEWTCAEVTLARSLGYGSYSFVVRDTSQLERAAAFAMFTYDYAEAGPNNREMGIEVSPWGDRSTENAQYVIQPYYVPENSSRFAVPSGPLTHSFRWEPGRVSFRTVRGPDAKTRVSVAQHEFTSGVPSHGTESVRITLYVFRSAKEALKNENEVVVEKFEYLP
jgi:hypothetical protein